MKNEHYDSEEAYRDAFGTALKPEYETIVRNGFLLQFDCPDLALERHLSYQDRPLGDFLGFVERVAATINKALENIPRDRVRLHVCWGNYEGPHALACLITGRGVAEDVVWAKLKSLAAGARIASERLGM
ncbi:MAG TPA: hypothetical protein VGF39_12880 [Stellaceae bacterium]